MNTNVNILDYEYVINPLVLTSLLNILFQDYKNFIVNYFL